MGITKHTPKKGQLPGSKPGSPKNTNKSNKGTASGQRNGQTSGLTEVQTKGQTATQGIATLAINDNSNSNPGFFSRLPAELRLMIWDEAYGVDSPGRIIQVNIRMTYPTVASILRDVPDFTITSPPGQYQAPDFQGGQINQESRALFQARLPDLLRFERCLTQTTGDHLGEQIDFNGQKDTILMDCATLFLLTEATIPLPSRNRVVTGFNRITKLATPIQNLRIWGFASNLRPRSRPGLLSAVADPIVRMTNVPGAIETHLGVRNYILLIPQHPNTIASNADVTQWFGPPNPGD